MFDATIIKENNVELAKAAAKTTAAAPKTPNAFVKFAFNSIFQQLPILLLAFAPALIKNKKSVAILRKADEVIDEILAQIPEE